MLKDITLGQYFPGDSLLHRLDPRMKLTLTMLFIVLVFLPQNWYGLGLVLVFLAAVVLLSRLPVSLLWRSMKPVLFIVALTAVLNVLYVTDGATLVQWRFIHITTGGLENAAKRALLHSGKFIPWQVVTISTDGRILD